MSNFAVFVIGPAGAGKSTFCSSLVRHAETVGRTIHLLNLDPAAEELAVPPSKDIRDLVCVEEVMEETELGPNGALLYCMDYLMENLEWLEDDLDEWQDEYIVVDCPGQIELYTHSSYIKDVASVFVRHDYRVCCVYLLESVFMQDTSKYFAGVLNAMSAMIRLEMPHINVVSKMDLIEGMGDLDRFLDADPSLLEEYVQRTTRPRFHRLNQAVVQLIEDYNLVRFIPCNIHDEESLEGLLMQIDHCLQYGESQEPRDPDQGQGRE